MISDFLGRRYQEALRQARLIGAAPERVRVICPPWQALGIGALRVVGVRRRTEATVWLLAYPDYERVPDPNDSRARRRQDQKNVNGAGA